ncbi:cytokinin dehydrogenase 3-like protein [Tanacetum coccineum]|uniref:Cytokinin dehydrogenase 3-like protein n=1 Tax=Tanacetum coccineum TaxID=301880 RepID=A0ABQ5B6K0_9ASTR
MERGFLSQKGSEVGRGVKGKNITRNQMDATFDIGLSTESYDTMNDVTPVIVASALKEGVTPSVVDMLVEKEKICSMDDTTAPKSFPPLTTPVTTTAGDASCRSSYANIAGKPSGKKVNVHTLFTPGGNGIDVVVLVDSIRAISERFANTAYGFFLGKKVAYPVVANYFRSMDGVNAMLENGPWFIRNNPLILKKWHPDENILKEDVSIVPVWVKLHGVPVTAFSEDGLSAIATKLDTPLMLDSYTSDMCMQSWGRSSYARVMIELRANMKLKDNIVVVMPKITREGHYTCNVRVEYEWKPPRCSSCKVFGHIHEECPKNTGAGEKKTVKNPSQTSRGVLVGPKMGFKPQKEYRPVPKKPNASSSGNKKKGVEPVIEVSNSNLFVVLNSVDNDVEFGTNGGATNLVNNGATSSGSSFMNIDNDGEFASNTPIGEKIDKIERQICEGKLRLLDNDGNPLVPTGIVKSDSEVEVVFDETANLRISTNGKDESDKGYGTNSLLKQWRDSYPDNDDYDPYDDDMYENHDLSEHLQSICDDLDITVRGRKK